MLAITAGTGCLVMIAYAVVFWKDIETAYYIHLFQARPGYLEEMLDQPDGTRKKAAVRGYVSTPQGETALCRILLGWHPEGLAALEEHPDAAGVCVFTFPEKKSMCLYSWGKGSSQGHLMDLFERPRADLRLSSFQSIPDLLAGKSIHQALPEHPGLRFALEKHPWGGGAYTFTIQRRTGATE